MTEESKNSSDNDDVQVIKQPVSAIKKKIGDDVDLKQVLTSGLIEEAQEIIDDRQQDFLVWVQADLKSMENIYSKLESNIDEYEESLNTMKRFALSVKSRGGTFGYDLASMVAKSLHNFCDQQFRPVESHMLVIRKHLDGLETIFHHKIVRDGGAIGSELIGSLQQLIEKYK